MKNTLLRGMPFIPEFHDVWAYPQKPYVHGIVPNAMDVHPLKYAWIDRVEAIVNRRFSRRSLIAAAPLGIAACSRTEEPYFGNTEPPQTQQLVVVLDMEPGTLDPAQALNRLEYVDAVAI